MAFCNIDSRFSGESEPFAGWSLDSLEWVSLSGPRRTCLTPQYLRLWCGQAVQGVRIGWSAHCWTDMRSLERQWCFLSLVWWTRLSGLVVSFWHLLADLDEANQWFPVGLSCQSCCLQFQVYTTEKSHWASWNTHCWPRKRLYEVHCRSCNGPCRWSSHGWRWCRGNYARLCDSNQMWM